MKSPGTIRLLDLAQPLFVSGDLSAAASPERFSRIGVLADGDVVRRKRFQEELDPVRKVVAESWYDAQSSFGFLFESGEVALIAGLFPGPAQYVAGEPVDDRLTDIGAWTRGINSARIGGLENEVSGANLLSRVQT